MYFDRFDIAEAWYLFLTNYHHGQWSKGYRRLCKLQESFTPGMCFDWHTLTDNGKAIYENLVIRAKREKYFPN